MATKKNNAFRVFIILLILTFIIGMTYVQSNQKKAASSKQQTMVVKKKQYVCSMHPEVVKDAPGDCPICGMSLIEKIDQDKNSKDWR